MNKIILNQVFRTVKIDINELIENQRIFNY